MKYALNLIILVIILSCSTNKNEHTIQGYWMQQGYGVYLEITDSIYKMYDVTEISCQPSSSASINNWSDTLSTLLDLYKVLEVNSELMILQYGITSYKFNRLEKPLELCNQPTFTSNDPKLNFDIFWHTFLCR